MTKIAVQYTAKQQQQQQQQQRHGDSRLPARVYKVGLVTSVVIGHIDIIAIYRRHRYHHAFPDPTATRCCSCWMNKVD